MLACSAMVGDAAAAETAAAEAQARAEAAVEAQIAAERQLREAAEAQASEADAVRTLRQSEPRQEASLLHIVLPADQVIVCRWRKQRKRRRRLPPPEPGPPPLAHLKDLVTHQA